MPVNHAIRVEGSRFWVIHRNVEFGPFDYEWSQDFCGFEMTYEGEKYGEYCSIDEICADLRPHRLPMSVVQVSSIVMGAVLFGLMNGLSETARLKLIEEKLIEFGYSRFSCRSQNRD